MGREDLDIPWEKTDLAEKIKTARGFGDLSENSEYDEAKNEQGIVEARIAEIEATLEAIKRVYMDRNYRDVSEQNEITEVVDRIETLIQVICPDLGATLVLEGSIVQYTGQLLALRAVKMPSGVEVFDAEWTSSDNSIVFFSNGKLYAIGNRHLAVIYLLQRLSELARLVLIHAYRQTAERVVLSGRRSAGSGRSHPSQPGLEHRLHRHGRRFLRHARPASLHRRCCRSGSVDHEHDQQFHHLQGDPKYPQ